MKKTTKQARAFLDDIPWINEGGCGVAALALFLRFKRKPKIVFAYNDSCRYDKNNSILNGINNNDKPVAPRHVFLKCGEKYFDSGGVFNHLNYKHLQEIPVDLLINALRNKGTWNNFFDRRNCKLIERELGIKFPSGIK